MSTEMSVVINTHTIFFFLDIIITLQWTEWENILMAQPSTCGVIVDHPDMLMIFHQFCIFVCLVFVLVTAVCGVKRTPDQVKRKWGKLKVETCRDISKRKFPGTGGGPKAREGPFTDVIADVMGKDSCRLYGIQGGYDTGHKGIFATGDKGW